MTDNPAGPASGFLGGLGFPPDPFQIQACEALDEGRSVLVAVPTGSGKTVVAEYAIRLALREGGKAFYTTPLKALSNQKYNDLVGELGAERVGLVTGDNVTNPSAPVVVMTTEVLRNMIYSASPALVGLRFAVLDEVHYLQNPYRGAVWEEVIVHAPPEVRLVCLSATVSNAEEVAAWLTAARGPTTAVIEEKRPVELTHLYMVGDRSASQPHLLPTFIDNKPNPQASALDAPALRPGHRPKGRSRLYRPRRSDVVERLLGEEMLPAIYFIFSRAACDDAVRACMRDGVRLTNPDERRQIREIAEAKVAALSDADLAALGYGEWLEGLTSGLAAHHAGLVPPFKETVEACFTRALVKVVFATETLSLGINMPARSVVIDSLSKFTGERHEALTPGEYTQLTGRAGRRGIDERGYAIVTWSSWVPFSQVSGLASTRTYELTSSFRPTYNMTANLVRRYDGRRARELLNLSFAQYRVNADIVALEARAIEIRRGLAKAEAEANCELGDIEGYRDFEATLRRARRAAIPPAKPKVEVQAALAKLRPGDMFAHQGRPLAVVATTRRRGGGVRIAVVTASGRREVLVPADFSVPPAMLGKVDLPAPYAPSDPKFLSAAARTLKRSAPANLPAEASERRHRHVQGPPRPSHPVQSCPDLRDHLRAAERADRLRRDLARLESTSAGRHNSLSRQLDKVLGLMGEWGYVEGWSLTPRGQRLSRIYHEQDLLIAACLDEGLFEDLSPPDLAAVASVFTFESRGRTQPPSKADPGAAAMERWPDIQAVWDKLQAGEIASGLPPTRPPDAGFMGAARAWTAGRGLERVLDDCGMPGGDFVRNIKQLADLLGQIAQVSPSATTAGAAEGAIHAMSRGVVAAATTLPGS